MGCVIMIDEHDKVCTIDKNIRRKSKLCTLFTQRRRHYNRSFRIICSTYTETLLSLSNKYEKSDMIEISDMTYPIQGYYRFATYSFSYLKDKCNRKDNSSIGIPHHRRARKMKRIKMFYNGV